MVATAHSRVVGTGEYSVGYLDNYGCLTIRRAVFDKDGTYTAALINPETGSVLKAETGKWEMSFFKVSVRITGESGIVPYTYNPLTNTLNNGGGLITQRGDCIYHKY